MKQFLLAAAAAAALMACSPPAQQAETPPAEPPALAAQSLRVDLALATPQGPGASAGYIDISESPGGAVFAVHLTGLTPGPHGFHVHQNASCDMGPGPDGANIPAGAAGTHYDPANTGQHLGPTGEGHLGDLPVLEADAQGAVEATVTAPRFTSLDQLNGRALMVHVEGDNYSDSPGGARMACGVIP